MRKRIILSSDIHNCHQDYYDYGTANRMNLFVDSLIEENEKEPIDAIILLGDYSLDFWAWNIKGCYINEGKSRAADFSNEYLSRLKSALPDVKFAMTAGNHEQYGEELWNKLTGFSRNDIVILDGYLILILDTFAGNLDPAEHSDGTYTGADTARIKRIIAEYPKKKVILCSHYFDEARETEDFRELCLDERIICLFCGHNHDNNHLISDKFGSKPLMYTGNFSYNRAKTERPTWGFRELIIDGSSIEARYIMPEITLDGDKKFPREIQDELIINS